MFASILKFIGLGAANAGSSACAWLFFDEPKTPKSLIK